MSSCIGPGAPSEVFLSTNKKRERGGKAILIFKARSLSHLEFINMTIEEMENDFWTESIFS